MKKLHLLLLSITLCVFSACHNDIWDAIDGLDGRVTKLEELCKEMNTNITALQTIVDVLQSNDFITSIVEIKKEGKVVGYTITFGKHDPITIYHGQDGKNGQNGTNGKDGQDGADGKDGQNGADGKDGITPVIGVAQDTDGVYYWTLNGEWLLDDNGNKLPVSGKDGQNGADGKDGQDGTDGKDGQDGKDGITPLLKIENGYWYISYDNGATWTESGKATGDNGQDGQNGTDGKDGQDGKDGVTPQLKIEEGYWFISYDNGATWTQLGKATGEDGKDGVDGEDGKDGVDGEDGKDGQNGADGKDGQDGDSMFQSVTQDENYVYFTLADGTVIKIAKASKEEQPNSEFMFIVTYDANGGEGVMQPDTFYYGVLKALSNFNYTKENSYFVNWNTKADGSGISYSDSQQLMISKNITLYAQWILAEENGHIYVDLGLNVKWAACNIGAERPEEFGEYFAWGETEPYDPNRTYKFSGENSKYNTTDNKIILDEEDDAAIANWGGSWRMPNEADWEELYENCDCSWIILNGVAGNQVTSKINGNSIFLPAAGYNLRGSVLDIGNYGFYWLNYLDPNYGTGYARYMGVHNSGIYNSINSRGMGRSIRPVCP